MELNAFITVFHWFQEYNEKTVKIELKNCKSGLGKINHFDKYVIFQIFNMQPFQIRQFWSVEVTDFKNVIKKNPLSEFWGCWGLKVIFEVIED